MKIQDNWEVRQTAFNYSSDIDSKDLLTEKQQKYQHHHQVKLINMSILQGKKYPSNWNQIIEQAKFTYFPLGKA